MVGRTSVSRGANGEGGDAGAGRASFSRVVAAGSRGDSRCKSKDNKSREWRAMEGQESRGRFVIMAKPEVRNCTLDCPMPCSFLIIQAAAALASQPAPAPPIRFSDAAPAAKLGFVAHCGTPAKRDIVEANGSGVAVGDFDGDGDLDFFFAQGSTLEELNAGGGASPELWIQDGGVFVNKSAECGLAGVKGWWTGVAAADADGDGDLDLYLCGYLKSVFLINERISENNKNGADSGKLIFTEKTAAAGLADNAWATGACWFDADNDGDLDLYLVRYLELDAKNPPRGTVGSLHLPCTWRGMEVYCGPKGFVATPDRFFKNNGGAGIVTFTDATAEAGFDKAPASYGLGVCPLDFDRDGDTDLYVANDSKANFLWRNDGGKFTEIGFASGVSLGDDGSTYSGMGVAADDLTGDGLPDIVVTNFSDEPVSLYKSRKPMKPGEFVYDTDTSSSGIGARTMSTLKWGVDMADFDLDGDLDIFVANGHVYPQADSPNTGTQYRQQNQVFMNDGSGKLNLLKPEAGSPLLERRSHRALALLDLDDDGDSDVLIVPVDGAAVLLRNEATVPSAGGAARVRIELAGNNKNTEALGAIITVHAGGVARVREVRRAGSYASSRDPRVCVGLGASRAVDKIEIQWPGGAKETVPGEGLLNCNIKIAQGKGVVAKSPIQIPSDNKSGNK